VSPVTAGYAVGMTNPSGSDAHRDVLVPGLADPAPGAEQTGELGETVGPSDVRADALRSGADVDPDQFARVDREDVPVGLDEAAADAARSGADPDRA
jgi:hypothetical protein